MAHRAAGVEDLVPCVEEGAPEAGFEDGACAVVAADLVLPGDAGVVV